MRGLDMSILNALRFLALAGQLSSLKQKSAGNHDELAFGLGRPRRTPTRVKRRNHGWRSSPSSRALSGELCQILPRTKNGKGSGITSIVTLGRTARTLFIVKMFSVVVAVAVHAESSNTFQQIQHSLACKSTLGCAEAPSSKFVSSTRSLLL